MDFINTLDCNARLLTSTLQKGVLLASVIARPTFRLEKSGSTWDLVPTPDKAWPIDQAPMQTPCGRFPGDLPFLNGGTDVILDGHARQPGGRPGRSLQLRLSIGSQFTREIAVFGDRVWRRSRGKLTPSEPEPFVSMPLRYENAFGGVQSVEGKELTCSANPMGKGFYPDPEQAEGRPLPNLEDPGDLIKTIDDQPVPVGVGPYPENGSLKPLNAISYIEDPVHPENSRITDLKPLLFNHAHPNMIIPPGCGPRPGEIIFITNVLPDGDLSFTMPDLSQHVHVRLENRDRIYPLHVDQIGIMPDLRALFFSCRVVFRYPFVRFDRRRTTLYAGVPPLQLPDSYGFDWT
jgi:hypothetical protein